MKNKRILFVINGTGLGNSTRCHAIISELVDGCEVEVATSGNGLSYFKDRREVSKFFELKHGGYRGKARSIGLFGLLVSAFGFARAGAVNSFRLFRILRSRRPQLVIYDSSFNLIPILFGRCPVVSINNSDRIVREFFRHKAKPWSIYPQFFLVECLDYLFQRLFPARVISPWFFGGEDSASGKFYPVGPIARSAPRSAGTESSRVVLLYSGSALGEEISSELESGGFKLDVIGRDGVSRENVRFLGRVRDSLDELSRGDLLVTNAGFSSLSEGIALGKPLVVLPIEGHAEQYINACVLESLGIARRADRLTISAAVKNAMSDRALFHRASDGPCISGARDAAILILRWLAETQSDREILETPGTVKARLWRSSRA